MKYQIGQTLWRATWNAAETSVECPDCGGSGHIRFLYPEGSPEAARGVVAAIECRGCQRGYDPPTGRVRVYERTPLADRVTVQGMEVTATGTEYHVTGSWRTPENALFETEADALALATTMCAEEDRRERDRVNQKEKDTRSWSWHVHYHRQQIRQAERSIAYHSAKLIVARVRAKGPADG